MVVFGFPSPSRVPHHILNALGYSIRLLYLYYLPFYLSKKEQEKKFSCSKLIDVVSNLTRILQGIMIGEEENPFHHIKYRDNMEQDG